MVNQYVRFFLRMLHGILKGWRKNFFLTKQRTKETKKMKENQNYDQKISICL